VGYGLEKASAPKRAPSWAAVGSSFILVFLSLHVGLLRIPGSFIAEG